MVDKIKLDIACGLNKREGFTGVDYVKADGVDIVHDLNRYPWPFESESVEEAHCSHYVEHIPMLWWNEGNDYTALPKDDKSVEAFFKFFEEVHRILVPGGKISIIAPYYSSMRCWWDPTHRRAISEVSFYYLSKTWRESNKLNHYGVSCDFDSAGGYSYSHPWQLKNEEALSFATRHYINVVDDVHVTLTKK